MITLICFPGLSLRLKMTYISEKNIGRYVVKHALMVIEVKMQCWVEPMIFLTSDQQIKFKDISKWYSIPR